MAEPAHQNVQTVVDSSAPKGTMMSYADFAAFVLSQVTLNNYLGKSVGLYTDQQLKFGQNADLQQLAKEAQEKFNQANSR